MKMKIVAIKDLAVQAFMQPNFVSHVGLATRQFGEVCNDEKHEFFRHAKDFEIYELGEFDDQTGEFDHNECPRLLARASDLKTQKTIFDQNPLDNNKKLN